MCRLWRITELKAVWCGPRAILVLRSYWAKFQTQFGFSVIQFLIYLTVGLVVNNDHVVRACDRSLFLLHSNCTLQF